MEGLYLEAWGPGLAMPLKITGLKPKVLGLNLSQCWMICCFTPNSRTKHWGLGAQMLILYGNIYLHAPWDGPNVHNYAMHWVSEVAFIFFASVLISFIPRFAFRLTENPSIIDFFWPILLLCQNEVICVWLFGLHIIAKDFGGNVRGLNKYFKSHCRSSGWWSQMPCNLRTKLQEWNG